MPPPVPTRTGLPRRNFLGGLAATAVAGVALEVGGIPRVAAMPGGTAASTTASERPNVVVILLDDLGWGELDCYGQRVIQTPVIDGLAAEGLRFTQAYANSVCAPSRASLLTGVHMGRGRIRSNLDAPAGFRAEDVTVAEVLKGAGYQRVGRRRSRFRRREPHQWRYQPKAPTCLRRPDERPPQP